MKKQRWAIIKTHMNYAVSDRGLVRNLNTGKLLKHQSSKRGGNYAFVNLCKDGCRINVNVHSLVAQAFLGRRPPFLVIHHKDLNRMNPAADNLEYITQKENCNKN